jgi:hypothetical protein
MDNKQIIIYAAIVAVVGIRLYQRLKKKDNNKPGSDTGKSTDTSFPSSSKQDDYEPYSKK